jgi:hypothetical protein
MRRKTTVYVEEDVLRATRIAAARTGKREYEVFEEALRAYLGLELLGKVGKRSSLDGDQAMKIAYREIHRSRRS